MKHFEHNFLANYKRVEDVKQDQEDDDDMDVVDSDQEPEQEDPLSGSDDFKSWLAWTTAHVRYLHCLLKLADRIDTQAESDDDFEDMQDDDSGEDG